MYPNFSAEAFPLESIGATPEIRSAFAPYSEQGLTLARVALAIRDEYRMLTGGADLHAEPAGSLLYMASNRSALPAVGDWVAVRVVAPGEAIVQAVLPRRTKFSRRASGDREDEQIVAVNIDTVFLVSGLDHDFNLRRIERYLTLAHESGADPVIVLNKADLCDDLAAVITQVRAIACAIPVLAISARSAEGIGPVLDYVGGGRTIALLGSSGAGKSTLANQLLGTDLMRTQEVREGDGRGRHTTTHRELIRLPQGGALIDNPGMRELQLWASRDSLDETFEDVAALAVRCRFQDCSHKTEPGCAIQEGLSEGTLDAERWASYEKLRAEIRYHEIKSDKGAAAEQKQKWKAIHKAARVYKNHW